MTTTTPILAGRVAVVTGGTSGIGLATARRLGREGARVAITGRDRRRGARARKQLGSEVADVMFIPAEASSRTDMDQAMGRVAARWGRVDLLVANAGVGLMAPLIETEEADFATASLPSTSKVICWRCRQHAPI